MVTKTKAPAGGTPYGLQGEPLTAEDLAQHAFFAAAKGNFKRRLTDNLLHPDGSPIVAAVRREYHSGDVICNAGEYGSTAFLVLEGSATATLPEHAAAAGIAGRSKGSQRWLGRLFSRRTTASLRETPSAADLGEVSAYATLHSERSPVVQSLGPGDFFGIDTCINFFPREATVRADERCVVVEMLRSVLDSVRAAGKAADAIKSTYEEWAVRTALLQHPLFATLANENVEKLARSAALIRSEDLRGKVLCSEGDEADALYLVRAGTVKIAQQRDGGEFIWAYLGRGAVVGLEGLLPIHPATCLLLACESHEERFAALPLVGTVTLGRRPNADVRFADKIDDTVSRNHCRFEVRDEDVYLIDDGPSDNGTFLNGERIRESIVCAGDEVRIASDYVFRIVREAVASPTHIPIRLATVSALDNVEVVKVPQTALMPLIGIDARLLQAATSMAGSLAALQPRTTTERAFVQDVIDLNLYNSQNVLLIDLDRCTRCDECVRACSDAHGGVSRFTRDGPRFGNYLVTLACRACSDPKCMSRCPVGSIRRHASLEIHIENWCVGCGNCAEDCPFGNINMVELEVLGGGAPRAATEPDELLAAAPIDAAAADSVPEVRATVCDLCAGYDAPSCVYACPHDAAIRVSPVRFLSPTDTRR
jgi:Fe-S-cluster-containing hydrogenase component 2/CRP-like cAMP-binding protein